jgi:hypothetical protein
VTPILNKPKPASKPQTPQPPPPAEDKSSQQPSKDATPEVDMEPAENTAGKEEGQKKESMDVD